MIEKVIILLASLITAFNFSNLNLANDPLVVTINDNGLEFQVRARNTNVGDLLQEFEIDLKSEDLVFPPKNQELTIGVHIFITRAIPVTLWDGGERTQYFTQRISVKDFLENNNIEISDQDRVRPDLDQVTDSDQEIKITRVSEKIIIEIKEIKFTTEYQDNPEKGYGNIKLIKEGVNGKKEQTFKVIYENRKEVKRVLLKEKILKEPKPEIKEWGTKIEIGQVQEGIGSWYNYPYKTQALPAASPIFPRGTYLRVTNIENGKQIIVKVRDFGPDPNIHPERIIDLSREAFGRLLDPPRTPGNTGLIRVIVEEIL